MRILVVGKKQVLRWPEAVAKTLAKTDEVSLFLYNKRTLSSIWHKLISSKDRFNKDAHTFRQHITKFKPDLIFFVSCFFIPQAYYDVLKDFPDIKAVGWTGDRFSEDEKSKAIMLDMLFCTDSGFLPTAEKMGIKTTFLPLCTDSTIFRYFTGKRNKRPIYVASGNPKRTEFIAAIQDKCDIWGPHWNKRQLKQHSVHVQSVPQNLMKKLICRSCLPFNLHFSPNNMQGLNFRTFDVPATGGLILTNDVPDLHKCYEVGKEAVTYKTPEELNELIHDFLQNPEKYAPIIKAGYERTMKEHTFEKRMEQMKTLLKQQKIL